jgi:hypothetical protein
MLVVCLYDCEDIIICKGRGDSCCIDETSTRETVKRYILNVECERDRNDKNRVGVGE